MEVLLAGASGAIGRPLVQQLQAHGHEVLGLARDPSSEASLTARGVRPVIVDALDRDALLRAVDGLHADAVVHELTALSKPPRTTRGMAPTDRLRVDGTANLLAAAEVLGARRFVTQSIIFGYGFFDHGERTLTEAAPFGPRKESPNHAALAAMVSTEQQTFTAPEGIALRYGLLYGGDAEQKRAALARRAIPVARGGGVLGWVHHDDAARATVAALEHGRPGEAYNVVDDEPATWREVFTAMAHALGTPTPRTIPRWMFRLVAPYVASFAVDTSMRVSNLKAVTELGWRPQFSNYRDGIRAMARTPLAPTRP